MRGAFAYDSVLGNLTKSWTSIGFETSMLADAVGADTSVWTPIDGTLRLRQRMVYDVMGRVVRAEDIAPSVGWTLSPAASITGTAPARTQVVKNEFDAEGRVLSVTRFTSPDSSSGRTAKSLSVYDAAGRVKETSEWHTAGSTTIAYDPAGNVTSSTSRRGLTVRQTYDALGRVVARMTPTVTFADSVCWECRYYQDLTSPDTVFIPTIGSAIDSYQGGRRIVMPAEVEVYGYDAAGRMIQADNAFARIRRGYFSNGALRADTTWLRVYESDAVDPFPTSTRSALAFVYDLSGRRTSRTDHQSGTQTFAYDSLGQLTSTVDQAISGGATVTVNFGYDARGRLTSQTVPSASVSATWTYDNDNRPTIRAEEDFLDSLWYDQRGKRVQARGKTLMTDLSPTGTQMVYDGLGQVAATANTDVERPAVTDEFSLDAAGNTLIHHGNRNSSVFNTEARDSSIYVGHKLTSRTGAHFPDGRTAPNGYEAAIKVVDSLGIVYDNAGNVTTQVLARREWVNGQNNGYARRDSVGLSITTNWYDAAERLRYTQLTSNPGLSEYRTRISEYRYDALGRRIAVRSLRDSIANCADAGTVTPSDCQSEYLVTTWDGDQVLFESRTLGAWQLSDPQVGMVAYGDWWGEVRYTQTGAIDAPVVMWRDRGTPRILHRNWRGSVAGATFASNGLADAATVWPAVNTVWYAPDSRASAPVPNKWMGTLVVDGRDATGTLYRRNRYYDPTSGRFTQQDPIGLAGGMNVYSYANGDPINQADPNGTSCERKGSDRLSCTDVQPGDWMTVSFFLGGASGRSAMNSFMSAGFMNWTPGTCRGGFNGSQCDQLAVVQSLLTVHSDPFCSRLGTRSTKRFQRGRLHYNAGIIRFPFPFHRLLAVGWAPPGFTVLSSELFLGGAYEATDELFDVNAHEERHHGDLLRRESAAEAAEARCKS